MTTPTDLSPTTICRDSQAQIRVTIDPETVAFYKLLIEQADCVWPFTDPLLPDCYAPEEPHQVIHLGTPLGCSVIDTHELTTCDRPATLAFAWRVEDEREECMWVLRPVCNGCVELAD